MGWFDDTSEDESQIADPNPIQDDDPDLIYWLVNGDSMHFDSSRISGWMAMNGEYFLYKEDDGTYTSYWFPSTAILYKESKLK